MKILIDFDAAMDMQYGIIKFIITSKKFNLSYFKPEIIKGTTNYLKNIIVSTQNSNIFYSILKDEYIDNADDLYEELNNKFYDEILNNASPSIMFKLAYTWNNAKDLDVVVSINCNNNSQSKLISKLIPKTDTFMIVNNIVDIKPYGLLMLDDIHQLLKYSNYSELGKTIYLSNKAYNVDNQNETVQKLMVIASPATIKYIDPYKGFSYFNEKEIYNHGI